MAERNQRMPDKSRVSRRGAKSRERPKNIEKSEHQLGPLTINTHLLDSFGLGPNYTDLQPIGFGANGLVVSAVNNSKKVKVAAKKIKIESQISCKYALREIRIMCKMQHDNIVRVLDVLHENGVSLNRSSGDGNAMPTDFSRVFLVQELLDTNLHVLITQKVLETDHVCLLFYQMLRGLHYLKSANIVHRDLKPSNLLINCDTLLLKIGDFGLARIIDPNYNHSGHLTAELGTYWYRAPELLLTPQFYSAAIDMWSVGCILGEMLFGKPLFTGATEIDQLRVILDSVYLTERDWSAVLHVLPNKMLHHHPMTPQCPLAHRLDDANPNVIDMLENLLVFDPNQRLTPEEGLAHHYLHPYTSPGREPIALKPFCIESEVDNLPVPILKQMIIRDSDHKGPGCGYQVPTPRHLHRPKVSSATLSLAPSASKPCSSKTQYLAVPTSPTYDNLIQEQRRNRRNKISTSLDLSFIELPGPDPNTIQKRAGSFCEGTQIKSHASIGTRRKSPAPPSPWKWPEVSLATQGDPTREALSDEQVQKAPKSDEASRITITPEPADEIILSYLAPRRHSRDNGGPKAPKRKSANQTNPGLSRMEAGPPNIIISRHSPGKESHLIASHVPEVRASSPRISVGESVSHHATREQNENRKNITVGLALPHPTVPQLDDDHTLSRVVSSATLQCIPVTRPRESKSPEPSKLRIVTESSLASTSQDMTGVIPTEVVTLPPSGARSSRGRKGLDAPPGFGSSCGRKGSDAPPGAEPSSELEETLVPPSTRLSAENKKSEALTGAVPSSERKVSVATIECEPLKPIPLPDSVHERKVSTASIECSPVTNPTAATKVSSAVIGHLSPAPQSLVYQTPEYLGRGKGEVGQNVLGDSAKGSEEAKKENGSLKSPPVYSSSVSSPEVFCEGCGEQLHCLTPGCGLLPRVTLTNDTEVNHACHGAYGVEWKKPHVSSPLLVPSILSDEKWAQEVPQLGDLSVMSPLSLDLSTIVNKELQKHREEEKDKAEVSPRKLQEDWEIESQSSSLLDSKAEWTLSEILGDCEEEVCGSACSSESQRIEDLDPLLEDKMTYSAKISSTSRTADICRAELEMVPCHIMLPDQAPQAPYAFSVVASSPQIQRKITEPTKLTSSSNSTGPSQKELQKEQCTSKNEDKFTSEIIWENKQGDPQHTGSASVTSNTADACEDLSMSKAGTHKEELNQDLSVSLLPNFNWETPEQAHVSMVSLPKFAHHKSEEDLSSPRCQSPRGPSDVLVTKAVLPKEPTEKSAFKQCLKDNLASLKVSIPKDLPEKKRLIKARSTEDMSFDGDSPALRTLHTDNLDSCEDLIQFSPVGGAKTVAVPVSELGHDAGAQCNHCLDQGDCNITLQCQSSRSGRDSATKNQSELVRLFADKANNGSDPYSSDEDKKPPASARADNCLVLASPPHALCLSKDVFNERQKLMSWDSGSLADRSESPNQTKNKVRPRSAKK